MARTTPTSPMPALSRALSRFFAWWGGELAALVPARLRLWWRESNRTVMLTFDGTRAAFGRPVGVRCEEIHVVELGNSDASLQRAETRRRLLQAAGGNFQLLLCLPREQVLQRTLTLPLAVEENVQQALAFELDRYTPFRPEQAYFAFRVIERDARQKRLSIDLAVVPKSVLDQCVARAATLGLTVDGAILADDLLQQGSDYRNFLPGAAKRRKPSARLSWRAALAALSAVLLAVLLIVPLWQKRAAVISLVGPLARAKVASQETDALHDRLRKLVKEDNFLHDKKWSTPSTVLVLNELSKLLPDDTFVMQLSFDGKTVQIQGDTASSTSLVEILEASPLFKDVSFKSQLTKIQGTPYDRYHLSATLKVAPNPALPQVAPVVTGATAVPDSPAGKANTPASVERSPGPTPASVNPGGKP